MILKTQILFKETYHIIINIDGMSEEYLKIKKVVEHNVKQLLTFDELSLQLKPFNQSAC